MASHQQSAHLNEKPLDLTNEPMMSAARHGKKSKRVSPVINVFPGDVTYLFNT